MQELASILLETKLELLTLSLLPITGAISFRLILKITMETEGVLLIEVKYVKVLNFSKTYSYYAYSIFYTQKLKSHFYKNNV